MAESIFSLSSLSSSSSPIPDEAPLPGSSPENPIFAESDFDDAPTVIFSADRAMEALKEACGENTAAFTALKVMLPKTFSHGERIDLHFAIMTGLVTMLSSGGIISLTDTTMVVGGATVLLSSAFAVYLTKFLFLQLRRYMDDSYESSIALHRELKRKLLSLSSGIEHNMLRYYPATNSFIGEKMLFNRLVSDREACLDNVVEDLKIGARKFISREDNLTSTKFNFYTFLQVLKYFGTSAVLEYDSIGGVAQMPIWRIGGKNSDKAWTAAFYSAFGSFPPEIEIPQERFVWARLLRIDTICHRGTSHAFPLVLFRDETILGMPPGRVWVTQKLSCFACVAYIPASMLLHPIVPVSVRQSYKRRHSSLNIVLQSRPTLFRDNDGRIADGDVTEIKRAWKGSYVVDGVSTQMPATRRRRRSLRTRRSSPATQLRPGMCPRCTLYLCTCNLAPR